MELFGQKKRRNIRKKHIDILQITEHEQGDAGRDPDGTFWLVSTLLQSMTMKDIICVSVFEG